MQEFLKAGQEHMYPATYNFFRSLVDTNSLPPVELPTSVLVELGLRIPKTMSGKFARWNDDLLKDFREEGMDMEKWVLRPPKR